MSGSLFDLDQSGNKAHFTLVALGPSLGRVAVPVAAEMIVTGGTAPVVLGAFASRVLLEAPTASVTLPLCSSWMTAQGPDGLVANVAGWDRSIWIKDLGGWA